jgi:hypothetical protein
MKYIFLSLSIAFALTFSSCSSSKKTTATQTNSAAAVSTTSTAGDAAADGSSFEKAILINEKLERPGVDAEYVWLKKNYPGYKMNSQSLSYHDKKPYDILHIETAEGKKIDVYFDISKFFGKF